MLEIIASGGVVGLVIFLLSIVAVAVAIGQARSLRKSVLAPPELVEKLRELIAGGQFQAADALCRENPSTLSFIVSNGLLERDGDWNDMEKTLEDAIAEQSAKLYRKAEFLSVIGNITPMLGLLGTVLGMIAAFQQLAATQGSAQGPELARGIYQALVTTVEGLIVAIPALAVFAFFRNRIDQLMAEVTLIVQQLFLPIKRFQRRRAAAAAAAVIQGTQGTAPKAQTPNVPNAPVAPTAPKAPSAPSVPSAPSASSAPSVPPAPSAPQRPVPPKS